MQIVILLLFNHRDVYSFEEIESLTKIPQEFLEMNLKSLAHPKSGVLLKSPNTSKFANEHTFCLNKEFKSKLCEVTITLLKSQVLFSTNSQRIFSGCNLIIFVSYIFVVNTWFVSYTDQHLKRR